MIFINNILQGNNDNTTEGSASLLLVDYGQHGCHRLTPSYNLLILYFFRWEKLDKLQTIKLGKKTNYTEK